MLNLCYLFFLEMFLAVFMRHSALTGNNDIHFINAFLCRGQALLHSQANIINSEKKKETGKSKVRGEILWHTSLEWGIVWIERSEKPSWRTKLQVSDLNPTQLGFCLNKSLRKGKSGRSLDKHLDSQHTGINQTEVEQNLSSLLQRMRLTSWTFSTFTIRVTLQKRARLNTEHHTSHLEGKHRGYPINPGSFCFRDIALHSETFFKHIAKADLWPLKLYVSSVSFSIA